ncbi:MAG TPA: hypothetical protein VN805_09170 [Caulobacteraceae bacterium]|nr:hypothetical protein [Caulobacteraceae bacterium]
MAEITTMRELPADWRAARRRWREARRGRAGSAFQRAIGLDPTAAAKLAEEQPELVALHLQERAQTWRLLICAVAVVFAVGCLIPIANGRPRYRGRGRNPSINRAGRPAP